LRKFARFEKIIAIPLDKPSEWVYTVSNDTARVLRADALRTLFCFVYETQGDDFYVKSTRNVRQYGV